ncbi:MAG: CinA family protein [Lautropia sp.]
MTGFDAQAVLRAAELGRRVRDLGGRIATAESCTGGLLAAALTETAGSSDWFDRGFVTYSNEAKVDLVGVRLATLAAHGAVSEAVAAEMAIGALRHSTALLTMAVTGIAGPGGAVSGKPVGTVCFGWALASAGRDLEHRLIVETRHLDGDRATVRRLTVLHAFAGAMTLLDRFA